MAQRYKAAEKAAWDKLKPWQRIAVQEDRIANKNSAILQQFVDTVIQLAEDEKSLTGVKN